MCIRDSDNGEHINIDIEQFEELFHIDGLVPLAKGLFPGRHVNYNTD